MDPENRVVVLIDMDCFYCQVEEKLNPELKGKPIAVVQYNPWKGGGIIAVNYVARAQGVTRHMRGDEAKEKCPSIELPTVPCLRGKADISKYREAGKEVARVLQKFTPLLERASIDEAYLDITVPVEEKLKSLNVNSINTETLQNTFALGYGCVEEFLADVHNCDADNIDFDYEHAKRLLVGAVIVSEIRGAVYDETGYTCSAGIAHNKILAKLVCGFNKPNKQTVLPKHSVNILYSTLSVKKVKHLGGKFGDTVCEVLRISKMAELQKFTEKELQARFDDKNGTWLYNIARGIDMEPVQARFNPKSIGCCKQLRGKAALHDLESLRRWLKDLGDEIDYRLEKDALENNRTPKQMVVSYSSQMPNGKDMSSSRSYNFIVDDDLCGELFSSKALELIMESSEGVKVKDDDPNRRLTAPIKFLGISVGKFEDISEKKIKKIKDYFSAATTSKENVENSKESKKVNSDIKNSVKFKGVETIHGKEYLMRKFFRVPERKSFSESNLPQKDLNHTCETHVESNKELINQPGNSGDRATEVTREFENTKPNPINNRDFFIESNLDEQESFFAKMLNQNRSAKTSNSENQIRPVNPLLEVKHYDEDTNDTNYSGSTINEEINKSVALFEEDPEDIARVTEIRQLLNTSKIIKNADFNITVTDPKENSNLNMLNTEMLQCTECGKSIQLEMVEIHADYHLALKLRDEERQQIRREKLDNTNIRSNDCKKKILLNTANNVSISSVANFFTKITCNIETETCSQCRKKVPLDKFSEHLDFHEAQKLNRELNKKDTNLQLENSGVKRKRKSTTPVKKNKMPCKPIESFFR